LGFLNPNFGFLSDNSINLEREGSKRQRHTNMQIKQSNKKAYLGIFSSRMFPVSSTVNTD
jgi:hypothetical protein